MLKKWASILKKLTKNTNSTLTLFHLKVILIDLINIKPKPIRLL